MRRLLKILFCLTVILIYPGLTRAAVVIQYHHVDSNTPASTSVSPEVFAQHMDYLANNGFQVWPLPQLMKALKDTEPLPSKVISITFDDGYKSVYTHALPVLQRHHFPFTVFINTTLVGDSDYMSWDQLRAVAARGATIANHTATHPHLVRLLDGESEVDWQKRIKDEIVGAENIIRKKIGHSPALLAYPYGEYNQRVKTLVSGLGLIAFAQNSGAFDQSVDWQAIPRFVFGGQYTEMKGFIGKVNSLPMPLLEAFVSDGQGHRLDDPLLPMNVTQPTLSLRLKTTTLAKAIHCYASGQGRIDVRVNGNTVTTRPGSQLPVGRSSINCTAASGQQGRYYWYSAFFMRKKADGSWYPE